MIQSRALKHERGQSLAEFAIVLPFLLLIVFAILDLGRAIYAYSVVADCAREGARFGQISTIGLIPRVKSLAVGLDPNDLTVAVSQPTLVTIQVDVTYLFHPITPVIGALLHWELPLHSRSTMYTGY